MRYDILLKGGIVVDPASQLNDQRDIGIRQGRVVAIQRNISAEEAALTVPIAGKYVTAGLVDMHTHVYAGVSTFGVKPDPVCTRTGVTTVVDAGSASWTSFPGFRQYVVEPAITRVLAFVHISGISLIDETVGEMHNLEYAKPEKVAQTVIENQDIAVGIKVRQGKFEVGNNGVEPLKLAIEAAELANVPVMCHIQAGIPLPEVLRLLRPGDIITHCFQGCGDGIIDDKGRVIPEVLAARKDGVIFDVGHGRFSFTYEVAKQAMEQGFIPDVISTDLHTGNISGPVHDLPTTLSKFLHLGLSLDEVIEKSTIAPARAIRRDGELGHLRIDSVADLAVWDLVGGEFEFCDAQGKKYIGKEKLQAHLTIRQGKLESKKVLPDV